MRECKLPGVKIFLPDVFEDHRGEYVMLFRKAQYGLPEFVEDCISTSSRGVLRGLHADYSCDKLISVLRGSIYYVVIDCRPDSPTRGQWESFILNDRNWHQVFKPAAYAAGFQALTDDVVFHYKQAAEYDPQRQVTYAWHNWGIPWPLTNPILSQRDLGHF